MKTASFLRFVAPSVLLMLALMALPLAMTVYLSLHHCSPEMEVVTVQQSGPFGQQDVVTQRARLDAQGKPVRACGYVGLAYFRKVLGLAQQDAGALAKGGLDPSPADADANANADANADTAVIDEFWTALRFTLLYALTTLPCILGLALALAVNHATRRLRGAFIAASLLPFVITPLVGALAIKWLFRDNGLVPYLLSGLGIHLHWMAQAWSAQLLIVLYGVWHVAPFAFIVLYAGLQSVPQDALEAASIDGANAWQRLRFVTLPHLAPLALFITLIHLMDAYRVFEPVLVLTQGAFTTSVQFLTYQILLQEDNPYKASAAAVLTVVGVGVLVLPLLVKTYREQRRGAH